MISSDESLFTQTSLSNAMFHIDETTVKILVPTDPDMGALEDWDQCYVSIELYDSVSYQTATVQCAKDGYLFVNDCCVAFNGPEVGSITGDTVIQPRVYMNPVKYSGVYNGNVQMILYDSNDTSFNTTLHFIGETAIDENGYEYQLVESTDIDQMASGEFTYPLVAVDGICYVQTPEKEIQDTFRIE